MGIDARNRKNAMTGLTQITRGLGRQGLTRGFFFILKTPQSITVLPRRFCSVAVARSRTANHAIELHSAVVEPSTKVHDFELQR